jgi:hypothetical protein
MNHNDILNATLVGLERLWGMRPFVQLACAGYADEHWQIYHPDDILNDLEPMPRVTIDLEAAVVYHSNESYAEYTEPAKHGL